MHRRAVLTGLGLSALPWRARAHGSDGPSQFESVAVDVAVGEGDPPLRLSLNDLMTAYGIPAVSVAVIDNYELLWANAWGVTEPGTTMPATAGTLFQAASISKTGAAVAAMTLVSEGRLALDGNVNEALKSWQVPDNDFTKTQKVTLRRLMSHTAGLSVHGFDGYEAGAPLPSVQQILDGLPPANSPPVRVVVEPGSEERYSGGGITVEQLLMTEVTGQAFPDILAGRVLEPFGMANSTYAQPLPATRAAQAASAAGYDGKVLPGKWHVYPEMAAAGLWTTPTDLASFLIGVARARHGDKAPISQDMATQMLTPQIRDGGFGLGFGLMGGQTGRFGHSGSNAGFRSFMQMDWMTGKGAVLMINSDAADMVLGPLMGRLRQLHGLNGPDYTIQPMVAMMAVVRLRGVDAGLRAFNRQFAANPKNLNPFEMNSVGYYLLNSGDTDGAIRIFRRAAEAWPNNANAWDSLAEAYMKNGQNDLAIENYRKSLALDPDNGNARQQLKLLGAN